MLDGVDISGPVNLPPPCLWRRCRVLHHDRIVSALIIQFVHWRVMCRTSIDSYTEFRQCAAGSQRRTFSEGRRRSRQPVECHKPRQSPAPGFGEKYWSLSGFPSHSLESGGGAFLTVIFGQILAYSAFSDSHFSSPGSLSALMASTGHSGSQTPQSMQFVRVDDEHVLALVEAVHGAHFDAVHGFAANAALVDDVGQLNILSADRSAEFIYAVLAMLFG